MPCKMCGKCCKAIRLPVDWDYILRLSPKVATEEEIKGSVSISDALFIRSFWKPISIEEALKINPHLKVWPNAENKEIAHYYTCTKFDESTNKCTIHDNRPRVCYGFPWYEDEPTKENSRYLYSESCGYLEEVKEGDDSIGRDRQNDYHTAEKKIR